MFYTFTKVAFPAQRSCSVYAHTYREARRMAAEKLGGGFLMFCVIVEGF